MTSHELFNEWCRQVDAKDSLYDAISKTTEPNEINIISGSIAIAHKKVASAFIEYKRQQIVEYKEEIEHKTTLINLAELAIEKAEQTVNQDTQNHEYYSESREMARMTAFSGCHKEYKPYAGTMIR